MNATQIITLSGLSMLVLVIIFSIITNTDSYKCSIWSNALYPNKEGVAACKDELKKYNSLTKNGAVYSKYTDWGLCKGTSCDEPGKKTRVRICKHNNKKKCKGDLVQMDTQPCDDVDYIENDMSLVLPFQQRESNYCPSKSNWSEWSDWSDTCEPVNKGDSCGVNGFKIRSRLCNNPYHTVNNVDGETVLDKGNCKINNGKEIQLNINQLNEPSYLSKDGNPNYIPLLNESITESQRAKERIHTKNISKKYTGNIWPPGFNSEFDNEKPISIIEKETKSCERPCIPVDGGVSTWSEWSLCDSAQCNVAGKQIRTRSCTNPTPKHGGKDCKEPLIEERSCSYDCQVHGGFSEWKKEGECDAKCGEKGKQLFKRNCNNPEPKNNGRGCVGESQKYEECIGKPCPIDGKYSAWSEWSKCSTNVCGKKGNQTRTRTCIMPQHGGKNCEGQSTEVQECTPDANSCDTPVVNGGWSNFSDWGACENIDANCNGTMKRKRTCTNPSPSGGGLSCTGSAVEEKNCRINC